MIIYNKIIINRKGWDIFTTNKNNLKKHATKIYSTLNFIDNLCEEIRKLLPKTELWKSKLSYNKMSIILGMREQFFQDIRKRLKYPKKKDYNPNYKFSKEVLNNFKDKLMVEFDIKAKKCLDLIKKYEDYNMDLRDYSLQQYHIHNPNLNVLFFKKIDTIPKAYWLGFLCADGTLQSIGKSITTKSGFKSRYTIKITLSIHDKEHLMNLCHEIGLDPALKIKVYNVKKNVNGKTKIYQRAEVQFGCKPMVLDLLKLEYKNFPEYLDLENQRDLLLAWLLGFYDGDGKQGTTYIRNTNKKLLERIKEVFKIKNKIHPCNIKAKESIEDINTIITSDHKEKPYWGLFLGSKLANEMMGLYKK